MVLMGVLLLSDGHLLLKCLSNDFLFDKVLFLANTKL